MEQANEQTKLTRQERDRARYLRNRDDRIAKMKAYYQAHRNEKLAYQNAYNRRKAGKVAIE